jgi:hypothetical protein
MNLSPTNKIKEHQTVDMPPEDKISAKLDASAPSRLHQHQEVVAALNGIHHHQNDCISTKIDPAPDSWHQHSSMLCSLTRDQAAVRQLEVELDH